MLNILAIAGAFVAGAFVTKELCRPTFESVVNAGNRDPSEPLPQLDVSWTILRSWGTLKELKVAATVTNGLLAGILAALILQLTHF
jgi:hypothetical protein